MQQSITYRGKDFPIRLINYKEVGSPEDYQTTMVGSDELSELLYHDGRSKVKWVKEEAEALDSRIGLFLHTVLESEISDAALLIQIHDKNPDFVFQMP